MKTSFLLKQAAFIAVFVSCVTLLHALKFEIPDELKDEAKAQELAEKAELEQKLEQSEAGTEPGKSDGRMSFDAGDNESSSADAEANAGESVELTDGENSDATVEPEVFGEGEGRIAGQIFDKDTGQPLRGVAIVIEGSDIGTITDSQGRYRLNKVPTGEYTLSFIKSGYIEASVTETRVMEGELMKLDFALPPRPAEMSDEVYVLQGLTVTAQEAASQNVALLALRQTSVASIDALSSEDFAKFAASDAAEAISKISGASLSDGKYVVMRGLNDRYNTTLINGVRLPSPDPDRKAVAMDIFPTSLFESIIARKTYTSDMPGESSGGSIELRTKSIPEEPFVKFSYSFGSQITSSNTDVFLYDPEQIGLMDWLQGKDNRGYQLEPGTKNFVDNYPTEVAGVDFPRMGPNVSGFPKFGDRSYSVSFGDSWQVNDWLTIGAIYGAKLGEKQRTSFKEIYRKRFDDGDVIIDEKALEDQGGGALKSEQEYSLSMLAGIGLQISDHTSLDYTYLRAESLSSSVEVVDYQKYYSDLLLFGNSLDPGYQRQQDIEILTKERLLEAHQFAGEHVFDLFTPGEWTFSWYYTDAFMSQEEPDQRITGQYFTDFNSFTADPDLPPVSRYQRETEQESEMYGWSLGHEFTLYDKITLSFEFGQDLESSERNFEQLETLLGGFNGAATREEAYVNDPYFSAMPFPDAPFLPSLFAPNEYTVENVFFSDFEGLDNLIQSGYLNQISENTPQFAFINNDLEDPVSLVDPTDIEDSLSIVSQLQNDFLEFNEFLDTKTLDDYNSEIAPILASVNNQQAFLSGKYGADLTVSKNSALNDIETYASRLEDKLQNEADFEAAVSSLDATLSNGGFGVSSFEALFGEAYTDSDRVAELLSDGSDNGSGLNDAQQQQFYAFLYKPSVDSFESSDVLAQQLAYNNPNSGLSQQLQTALANFEGTVEELQQFEQQLQAYLDDAGELAALINAPAMNYSMPVGDAFNFADEDFYVFRTPRGFTVYADEKATNQQFPEVGGYFQARGENKVKSLYLSGDIKIDDILFMKSVRLAAGFRHESTQLSYEQLGNARNEDGDFLEPPSSSVVGANVSPFVVVNKPIDQSDRLGYVALILEPLEGLKIHLSGSTTVAKPTFREIAPFPIFNLADRSFEVGNPGRMLKTDANLEKYNNGETLESDFILPEQFSGLEIAEVESRDVRIEYYTPMDGMISIGYFEKKVAAPIERVYAYSAGGVDVNTFINNNNDASLRGVEFEFQQNLGILNEWFGDTILPFDWITVGGNYTKINAEIDRSDLERGLLVPANFGGEEGGNLMDPGAFQAGGIYGTRSLYNQPSYVANAFISFDIKKTGTMVTLSSRWTGEQLDRAGGISPEDFTGEPDLYWDEFSALNLVIEQKIGENWKLRFAIKNLDSPVREMFEDDSFFSALVDDTPLVEQGGTPVDPEEYRPWRSRQKIEPTYSISLSGSF